MSFIEDMKSEIKSLEERYLAADDENQAIEPNEITDEPNGESLPSNDIDQAVFKEEPNMESPKEEMDIADSLKEKSAEDVGNVLGLCVDAAMESLFQAKEILNALKDREDINDILTDALSKRFDDLAEEASGVADDVDAIVYDYVEPDLDDSEEKDTIEDEPNDQDDIEQGSEDPTSEV